MRIVIPGKPKYQKRHRTGKNGTYNPSATDKKAIKKALLAYKNGGLIDTPCKVEIVAYYPFLKSWSKKEKAISEGAPKITKPDADNIAKLYLDAMNDVILLDDNIICDLRVVKLYSIHPCVVIDIEPYEV